MLGISVVQAPRWPEGVNKASGGDSLGTVDKGEQQARQVLYQVTTRRACVFRDEPEALRPMERGKYKFTEALSSFEFLLCFPSALTYHSPFVFTVDFPYGQIYFIVSFVIIAISWSL